MILRIYQERDVTRLRNALRIHQRIIYSAPPGCGKTVTFAKISSMALHRNKRVMVLVSRVELLQQAAEKFKMFDMVPEIILRDTPYNKDGNIFIASVQTLQRRDLPKIDLLIVDEAHLALFDQIIEKYPAAKVIGFTATPTRPSSATPLKKYYTEIVSAGQYNEFVEQGFLCKPIHYGTPLDLSAVKITGNDYDPAEQFQKIFNKPELYTGVVENYKTFCPDAQAIVYCTTVLHSLQTAAKFNEAGIIAEHLDGTTPKQYRAAVLDLFRSGEVRVICNNELFTVGLDLPNISSIIFNRATKSLALWLQAGLRGGRPYTFPNGRTKKHFTVLDFGGNTFRHGLLDSDREWSLTTRKKRDGIAPVKNCPACQAIIHATHQQCEYCGHLMPFVPLFQRKNKQVELIKLELPPVPVGKPIRECTIQELEAIRQSKGYKLGWVVAQIKSDKAKLQQYAAFRNFKPGWIYRQLINK